MAVSVVFASIFVSQMHMMSYLLIISAICTNFDLSPFRFQHINFSHMLSAVFSLLCPSFFVECRVVLLSECPALASRGCSAEEGCGVGWMISSSELSLQFIVCELAVSIHVVALRHLPVQSPQLFLPVAWLALLPVSSHCRSVLSLTSLYLVLLLCLMVVSIWSFVSNWLLLVSAFVSLVTGAVLE